MTPHKSKSQMHIYFILVFVLGMIINVHPLTNTITSYTVRVGNLVDGTSNPSSCSATSQQLTCNVRSAWSYCMSLITSTACPSTSSTDTLALSCSVLLPSNTTSVIQGATYGTVLTTSSSLTTWASTCNPNTTQVLLSMKSSSNHIIARIVGDNSAASLLVLKTIPFLSLSLLNISIVGFGNGNASSTFLGAVSLQKIQGKCGSYF